MAWKSGVENEVGFGDGKGRASDAKKRDFGD